MKKLFVSLLALAVPSLALASEADLRIPALTTTYDFFGITVAGTSILGFGMVVSVLGMLFGLYIFRGIKKLPSHKSMLEVSRLNGG